jgi:hypothetical protein
MRLNGLPQKLLIAAVLNQPSWYSSTHPSSRWGCGGDAPTAGMEPLPLVLTQLRSPSSSHNFVARNLETVTLSGKNEMDGG